MASSSSQSAELSQLVEVQLAQLLGPNKSTGADFESLHILGQGAHGTTRMVRRKHDGHLLCRKWISIDRLQQTQRAADMLREVEILMMLDGHPHVIGFVGAYVGDGGLNIMQEYAEGGTLQHRLDRRRERNEALSEPEVLDAFVQIAAGLSHLHAHRVLHRDVKPQNIFFDRRNLCRLGDFGIAAFSSDSRPSKFLGTPLYLSPELIEGRACDHKADLWALGIVLYEMVRSVPSCSGSRLAISLLLAPPPRHHRQRGSNEALHASESFTAPHPLPLSLLAHVTDHTSCLLLLATRSRCIILSRRRTLRRSPSR